MSKRCVAHVPQLRPPHRTATKYEQQQTSEKTKIKVVPPSFQIEVPHSPQPITTAPSALPSVPDQTTLFDPFTSGKQKMKKSAKPLPPPVEVEQERCLRMKTTRGPPSSHRTSRLNPKTSDPRIHNGRRKPRSINYRQLQITCRYARLANRSPAEILRTCLAQELWSNQSNSRPVPIIGSPLKKNYWKVQSLCAHLNDIVVVVVVVNFQPADWGGDFSLFCPKAL